MIRAIRTQRRGIELFRALYVQTSGWQDDFYVYVKINDQTLWEGSCRHRDDDDCSKLLDKAYKLRDRIIDRYVLVNNEVFDLRTVDISHELYESQLEN